MPRSRFLGLGLLLAGFGAIALIPGGPLAAQKPPPPLPAEGKDKKDAPILVQDGFDGLTFPSDEDARDARQLFEAVRAYLEQQKNPPWDRVCDAAQRLLDAKSDYFYKPKTGNTSGQYVSIKAQTNQIIGTFPKDGRQFYQVTYGPVADALLKEAAQAGWDKAKLADVSQRYFHTTAGGQATLLLASLNLEAGHYSEAAFAFDRLISRPDSDDLLTPKTLLKAAIAFKRAGDPKHTAAADKTWELLEKKFPRDGLAIGRRTFSLDDLRQEFTRPVEMLFGSLGDDIVSMRYGNPSHTGIGIGGTPFLDPAFRFDMLYRTADESSTGAEWIKQAIEQGLKRLDRSKGQVPVPGFFPVTAGHLLIFRTYDAVYAISTKDGYVFRGRTYRAGELVWATMLTKGGLQNLMGGGVPGLDNAPQTIQQWWQQWQVTMPTLTFENAQVGSLSHDGKLVYFVDDLGLPPPPQVFNPNMGGFPQNTGLAASLRGMTEYSRLVAVDIETGKRRWELGGPITTPLTPEEEERSTNTAKLTEGAIFLGPPLPVNGKLYVLYERNQQLRLACYDPFKLIPTAPADKDKAAEAYPELLWVQKLGSPNLRANQDTLRRIQPAYLAYSDGVLVCPTNCGAVIAVDVNARSLLWARGYGSTNAAAANDDPNGNPVGVRIGRPIRVPNQGTGTLSNDRWRAAAPIISAGKVIVTAHDASQIQCLNLRTGDLLWKDDRKQEDLYVGGVIDNRVLVVGKESVRAYELNGTEDGKPVVAWQNLRIGTPSGHGVASKDGLYFLPMVGDPDHKDSKDPQVWAIDVARGMAKSKTAFRKFDPTDERLDPRLLLGNLVFHDGMMFSQSAVRVAAFPLIELKKQEMDRLLALNPKDPVGLTDRGELLLDNGKIREAVLDFKEAEKHDPSDTVRRKIRQKLYQAYTEMLRNDFAAGESVLSEYEALCEIPLDTEDPIEKQRVMDEQVRRRGLFLSLVAKGREKQGRLIEAFKYYRAFAALGDNKQLVAIFDEPNSMTRPDVWARGRIDAMIRNAKDPAVRKPLEEQVQQDWETVKSANDLGRLREFVKVFGPYFRSGREGQLLLAERLLLTNNDEDTREAQVLLMQLWATADDAPTQARAIETLARVMTRRGMLEDAVGLYLQLGSKFADVEVRDGKTGADIYGDLITDKRLLPYLEPIRSAAPSKYKVDMQTGPANRPFNRQMFTVQPDGELFPFFQRYRLSMEMNQNGNGTWMLRIEDRVTGEEYCKFADLSAIQSMMGFNQGPPSYRIAQASGHMLLMNIGQYAYCFDLAQKRELWRYDLFKKNPQPLNVPPQIQQDRDELLISYEDGWTLRLGRSAVLQPTYACLVTRDGLVAVDPVTGQELWQRSNVSTKSQVFGDAKYVFLVETTGAGTRSKVLRAVDGSVVEGVPDFATVFTSPGRINLFGRNILQTEGGTDKPRVLRLYDPFTGKDLWKKEYPADSVVLKSMDPKFTGCFQTTGRFEVLDSESGKKLFEGGVDADRVDAHLKTDGNFAVKEPVLLADSERFYLFLNRDTSANRNRIYGHTMLRSERVNGVAYGFDRASGKRLWFNEGLFENQAIILERFDDLPVLIAASQLMDPSTRTYVYKVTVFDKQLGKVRHNRGYPQNGFFVSMFTDPKTRAVELWRYDLRLRIVPEDDLKVAGK